MTKPVRIILDILILLTLVFIWGNSMLSAPQSNELSISVVEKTEDILGISRPESHDESDSIIKIIRKSAHAIEFFVLGSLLALRMFNDRLMPAAAFVLSACVGVMDECIQIFSDRTQSVKDVFIDCGGAAAGILVIMLIGLFIRLHKTKTGSQ